MANHIRAKISYCFSELNILSKFWKTRCESFDITAKIGIYLWQFWWVEFSSDITSKIGITCEPIFLRRWLAAYFSLPISVRGRCLKFWTLDMETVTQLNPYLGSDIRTFKLVPQPSRWNSSITWVPVTPWTLCTMCIILKDWTQALRKLFEKGGADFAPGPYAAIFFIGPPALESRASPEKADERGGGDSDTFFSLLKKFRYFRHGIGVSSYIINLYNKHSSKKNKKQITSNRGVRSHPSHAPPPPLLLTGLLNILVKFDHCIIVSLWTFQPTLVPPQYLFSPEPNQ